MSFTELAFNILSLFIPNTQEEGGIPSADLKSLIDRSFSTFRAKEVSPLRKVSDKRWCLELWHGPTFAFKDVALQTLGNLFEYFLSRKNASLASGDERHRLTVVGATSGDTGSAAIAGLRSKADIDIYILHPKGRVSPIQEAQMTTILDENVHNLAVEGTFDDCQDVVKMLFGDKSFNEKHHLAAINSINFARILAQIVYYFSAYFQFRKQVADDSSHIQFVVPTGNFGDILAGYFAKRLGLPMAGLVVATNENDILQRFWSTGRYEKSDSGTDVVSKQTAPVAGSSDGSQAVEGGVRATLSPAMDILVSSNFERLLWYIALESQSEKGSVGRRAASDQVRQWMDDLKTSGRVAVSQEQLTIARRDFQAQRVSDAQTKTTILKYFTAEKDSGRASYLIDPHTAVGFHAADTIESANDASVHQIVLSTAHPAKFAEAVTTSLESANVPFDFEKDVLPPEMIGLLEKERRVIDVRLADVSVQGSVVEKLAKATQDVVEKYAQKIGSANAPSTQALPSV
jgi:threonine synthase